MDYLAFVEKYKFGQKYRRTIIALGLVLLLFYCFVVFAPLITFLPSKNLEDIKSVAKSLSNFAIIVFVLIIIVEGQRSINTAIEDYKHKKYVNVKDQIIEWFEVFETPLFESSVVTYQKGRENEFLGHFRVIGNRKRVMKVYKYDEGVTKRVDAYCTQVHFELTIYPKEILYGVHFEFYNKELNIAIFNMLAEKLDIKNDNSSYCRNTLTPKDPSWLFLTNQVVVEKDIESDFANVLTHCRHFVETVGLWYNTVYSKDVIDLYLDKSAKFDLYTILKRNVGNSDN